MIDPSKYERISITDAGYSAARLPGKTTGECALRFAKEHREVHLRWLEHWRRNPPSTAEERLIRKRAGGVKHQEIAIRRYDVIVRALEAKS